GECDDAILLEVGDAAGMVAVEVGQDRVFDRQRRDRLDRRLDLVAEWGELCVHHDDAVGADGDRDVAARPFQPVGLVAEIDGLDLDVRQVLLRIRSRYEERGGRRKCEECNSIHLYASLDGHGCPMVGPGGRSWSHSGTAWSAGERVQSNVFKPT